MSGTDSGIETGSESNGSTSMSVESPPRLNADNDHAEPQDEEVGDAGAPFFRSVQPLAVQCLGAMATESSAALLGHGGAMEDGDLSSLHAWHGKMRMLQRRARRWRFLSGNCAAFRNIIGERKLRIAAITNQIPLVRRLLETGVNPCAADERSRTALHFAACKGHLDIIKMLLEHGANPNQRDIVGNTPLHLAVCTSHTEVITHLLKAGTDVNSLDNSGRTPLHLAQSKLRVLKVDVAKSSEKELTCLAWRTLVADVAPLQACNKVARSARPRRPPSTSSHVSSSLAATSLPRGRTKRYRHIPRL
ncbi:hypothetical protein HPB51_024185 [Rhipicephalus microplus]|uniref:Uncharacterized protein n=1 Tax=Rhipicephalus microplus TaxID=6941 RepID=A0A9J6DX99_RHIMP|nr:hypothetical protein HPB51_024185 [Rhipicephalus microplus]